MTERLLPDYENPPAVETALGVRFAPIQGWNIFHYGLLLEKFQDRYPKQELKPPIGDVNINISPEANFADLPVRCWFINPDDSQLIQVQNSGFVRNWRKTERTPDYLHYDVIRPLFRQDWEAFLDSLSEFKLPSPNVWQCEVTYVNHFVRGREWQDFNDLPDVYEAWKGLPGKSLLESPQTMSFLISYALPDGEGSLQFSSQPAIRRLDGAEIIQLTVTAFGRPESQDVAGILAWMDKGRAAVVSGFTQFTTERCHSIWGIK